MDFGARFYDPRIGVWKTPDLRASKYPDLSSYSYCANNPILFVDPDGNVIKVYGSPEFIQKVKAELQKLTEDEIEINAEGIVTIIHKSTNACDKQFGTSLVSDLVSSIRTVNITNISDYAASSENSTNSGTMIMTPPGTHKLNPGSGGVPGDADVQMAFVEDKNVALLNESSLVESNEVFEKEPDQIQLGKELVYAQLITQGKLVENDPGISYLNNTDFFAPDKIGDPTARMQKVIADKNLFIINSGAEQILRSEQNLQLSKQYTVQYPPTEQGPGFNKLKPGDEKKLEKLNLPEKELEIKIETP